MHWGQIKTLFILCFLLLNIYLLFLVVEKQKEADFGILDQQDNITIEQRLESENITISADIPEYPEEDAFVLIRQKRITDTEIPLLEQLENQEVHIIRNNYIVSKLEETIALPENASGQDIKSLVDPLVIYSDEYVFDSWNQEFNMLVFFQKKNNRPVYFNQNGMILFFLNDNNELIGYTQTILGDPEPRTDKKTLIEPIMAVDALYENNQLSSGEDISDIEMGYQMMLPLDNGVHILVPTWKVSINDGEKEHYVNAVESYVFPVNNNEIMAEAIESGLEKIRTMEGNREFVNDIFQHLRDKLEVFESE